MMHMRSSKVQEDYFYVFSVQTLITFTLALVNDVHYILLINIFTCGSHVHEYTYFASRARAMAPETIGVAALVPLNSRVHTAPVFVVLCKG